MKATVLTHWMEAETSIGKAWVPACYGVLANYKDITSTTPGGPVVVEGEVGDEHIAPLKARGAVLLMRGDDGDASDVFAEAINHRELKGLNATIARKTGETRSEFAGRLIQAIRESK